MEFALFFHPKTSSLHSELVLVRLHGLERRIIDTLLRRLYGYDGGTYREGSLHDSRNPEGC